METKKSPTYNIRPETEYFSSITSLNQPYLAKYLSYTLVLGVHPPTPRLPKLLSFRIPTA